MCLEDIRLGRELAPQARLISVQAATLTTVCDQNPDRTRIVVSAPGDETMWLQPEGFSAGNNRGFALTAGSPQMTIRVEEWGRLVTGKWTVWRETTPGNLVVMEAELAKK